MSPPSQSDGSPALPAHTMRSDALILATICEQLRVEWTRPAYARLAGAADPLADPLAATLQTLYALRDAPDRPDVGALLMASLGQIIDVGQRMRAVADDAWTTRPPNSAPSLPTSGRRDAAARPLDTLLDQLKAKQTELRALLDEPEPMTARVHDARFDSSAD